MDLNAQYQTIVRCLFSNAEIIVDRFHIVQLVERVLDKARLPAASRSDHTSREYKVLKSEWKIFHILESSLNASKSKYYRGLGEYSTQQNIVDLGLDQSEDLKHSYDTYQSVLEAAIRTNDISALSEAITHYKKKKSYGRCHEYSKKEFSICSKQQ